MKITNHYHYEQLERVTAPDGARYYVDPSGARLSSVTTILSATSDNAGLQAWRDYVGDAKADKIRDEATGLGSLMHEHLECHIQEIERPRGTNLVRSMARKMADTIIKDGLVDMTEVWGIESPLYFPERYAGTTDLLGLYKGEPAILDYKTTNKMKTKDQITDYCLQLCAYADAHNILYGTDIKTGVIFMVSRDCQFKTFVITGDEYEYYLNLWNQRVSKFYELKAQTITNLPR